MKFKLIFFLIFAVLVTATSCGNKNVTCPTYQDEYVYEAPKQKAYKHKKVGKKKKAKVKAEQ